MLGFFRGWRRVRTVERVASAPEGKYPTPLVVLSQALLAHQREYSGLDPHDPLTEVRGPRVIGEAQQMLAVFELGMQHFEQTGRLPEGF